MLCVLAPSFIMLCVSCIVGSHYAYWLGSWSGNCAPGYHHIWTLLMYVNEKKSVLGISAVLNESRVWWRRYQREPESGSWWFLACYLFPPSPWPALKTPGSSDSTVGNTILRKLSLGQRLFSLNQKTLGLLKWSAPLCNHAGFSFNLFVWRRNS